MFGVGDDDQVIYGHAGASPRFLVDFERFFPSATPHALQVNYRCPEAVVTAATHLLGYNHLRVRKEIRPGPHAAGDPERLDLRRHPAEQGGAVLTTAVQEALERRASTADVAVLARTNSLLLAPHVALADAGVPLASVLRPSVLDRLGVRATLAWLRIANDPGRVSPADLAEVRRRPSRGLPRWIDKWLSRCRSGHDVAKAAERIDDERVALKLAELAGDMDDLSEVAGSGTTRDVLVSIRDDIGLGGAMDLLDARPGAEGSSHGDDLDALVQVASLETDPARFETHLRSVLTRPPDHGGVTLSTVHRVKGQEWPEVIIFGANAGLLPHRLAVDTEEERRVFHVAITRAAEHAVVLADAARPSPFLTELSGTAPRRPAPPPTSGDCGQTRIQVRPTPPAAPAGAATPEFEALRAWRSQRARADGVPAYVVFSNATLDDIVARRPTTLAELARCSGIGPTKLDRYGDDVLEVLASLP